MVKVVLFSILTVSFGFLSAQVDLNKGLVASYNFNKNVKNSTGSHSNGTNNGGVFTSSKTTKDSQCLVLDGVNDNVTVSMDSFDLTNYTYSLWTKSSSNPASGTCETIFNVGGVGGDQSIQLCNNLTSSEAPFQLNGYYGGGYKSGTTQSRAVTGVLPDTSQWYHLAVVRFEKGIMFYVNCKLIDSIYDGSSANYGSKAGVTIGSRNSNTNYYHGKIDNLRIYNRAVSSEEIKELGGCNKEVNTVSSILAEEKIELFPNPTQTLLNITSGSNQPIESYTVYTILGKKVISTNDSKLTHQIDCANWESATYIIEMKVGNEVIRRRFQKL